MTTVLPSKHYAHDGSLDMDLSSHLSSPITDSDTVLGSPSFPLVTHDESISKLEEEEEEEDMDREHLLGEHCKEEEDSEGEGIEDTRTKRAQLSLLALLLAAFRRSGLTCRAPLQDIKMEIGYPTEVRHITHVTFDRFKGFLGLPVEFEMEIPRRVPSASVSVFGVSPESMQCAYDGKGNSVPIILLLMQGRLYEQGGLEAEGIFRINAENSQEEHVRNQLNKGIVPHDIDVHCLAGLIKAWFRELPRGVLDALSPEQVMHCHTEEQSMELVELLPHTQYALLDWAINLMADVVQKEEFNKMNARNIAMVFAPNMTQMSDPLTALMHAVQVMNFLKTLILRVLRERDTVASDPKPVSPSAEPENESGDNHTDYEPCLALQNKWIRTDDGPMSSEKAFLLKGSSEREYSELTEQSEQILLVASNPREMIHNDESLSKIGNPASEMADSVDSTDDGFDQSPESELLSNAEGPSSNDHMRGSYLGGAKGKGISSYLQNITDGSSGLAKAGYASNNHRIKPSDRFACLKDTKGYPKGGTEKCNLKDVMHHGGADNLSCKGKFWDRKQEGKVNQHSKKAEPWY